MKYKVLIADDELIIRKGITKLIQSFSLDIEVCAQAKTGIEMLEMADSFKPNIIIADINMPMLNGLDAIKKLRKQDKSTAIIIVSGYQKFEYAKQAIDLGVISYILKPFSNDAFKEILVKAINFCDEQNRTKAVLNRTVNAAPSSKDILEFINENYCNPEMSLSFLEEKFPIGRTTIGNYIRNQTGKTPVDYINFLRIEHGKSLLLNNEELSVNAVSDILGFNNQHYFSRVFKHYCGVSPSVYRAQG